MGKKIGFYTLRHVGQRMCKYIVQFTPGIRAVYPDNTLLLAALEAALVACQELDAAIAAEETPGI